MAKNSRGIALVVSLLILVVLAILLSSFFLSVMNENNLARRYADSVKAFWLAEAGVATGIASLPTAVSSACLSTNECFSAVTTHISGRYYQIDSTGTVSRLRGGNNESVSRLVSAVAETSDITPNNFQHAIETTVDLVVKGSVDINPGDSWKEFADINFPDLFGYSKEDVKGAATHTYTDPPVSVLPCTGITWVNVSPGGEFKISSSTWSGSGILVVAGDAQITGGTFSGIIYVIGKLRMSGNPVINGAVLAESKAEIEKDTTLTGNVTLNYDVDAITNALALLQFIAPKVVAWREP